MLLVSTKSAKASKLVSPTLKLFLTPSVPSRSSCKVEPLSAVSFSQAPMSQTFGPLDEEEQLSPKSSRRGSPLSARIILLISEIARTWISRRLTSAIAGVDQTRSSEFWNEASCLISSVPTMPVPMMPTEMDMSERVKPACAAERARERSTRGTTAEMLRSEEPWAIAMMLTLARPRALKKRPLMLGRFRMPSPITATMLTLRIKDTFVSSFRAISNSNACRTPSSALSSSRSSTATVMECSEEPWEVRITFTPTFPSASIIRFATPGVPRKDAPERVTSPIFSIDVMPFTGMPPSSSLSVSWSAHCVCSEPRP
mmetsp:Transcript_37596/g.82497  ORF Transcript_37596/g.82497 Transcript_37596/m.82497 type:complete len:314 (-) Transcript_37596:1338-2279(-)